MSEPIDPIQSAFLSMGGAIGDIESARDAWVEERWNDVRMWASFAIGQLESAKAKVARHQLLSGEATWGEQH